MYVVILEEGEANVSHLTYRGELPSVIEFLRSCGIEPEGYFENLCKSRRPGDVLLYSWGYVICIRREVKRMTEAEKEARALARLRDRYKLTVCSGCHNNRYNFESGADGLHAPTSGGGCWSLQRIKRGVCSVKRKY
jgi:hypothetical protein